MCSSISDLLTHTHWGHYELIYGEKEAVQSNRGRLRVQESLLSRLFDSQPSVYWIGLATPSLPTKHPWYLTSPCHNRNNILENMSGQPCKYLIRTTEYWLSTLCSLLLKNIHFLWMLTMVTEFNNLPLAGRIKYVAWLWSTHGFNVCCLKEAVFT